jgi:hypothetical protein
MPQQPHLTGEADPAFPSRRRLSMHDKKLLLAVMIAATTFATPVLAAGHRSRHAVIDPGERAVPMTQRYEDERTDGFGYDGYSCIRAPRVGAFATQPWTDTTPCEPSMGY